jgi:hypothetical protein
VGITCDLQQFTAGFILNRMFMLAVTHAILTCGYLYITQNLPHLFIIIPLTFPQPQVMAQQTPQQGVIASESSRTTCASSNAPPAETHQQCRHQLVHHNPAIAATANMTQDTNVKAIHKTRLRNDKKQHAIRGE